MELAERQRMFPSHDIHQQQRKAEDEDLRGDRPGRP
jgi:hypothetical protein